MSWSVFFFEARQIGDRLGFTVTLFLAAVC
jgi:hypothetical protein